MGPLYPPILCRKAKLHEWVSSSAVSFLSEAPRISKQKGCPAGGEREELFGVDQRGNYNGY